MKERSDPPAPARAPRLLALAAVGAALSASGCPVPDVLAPTAPPRVDPPEVFTGPVLNEPPAPRPRLRVLWRGRVPAELGPWVKLPDGTILSNDVVSLLGVDGDEKRAFFTRSPLRDAPWFEVAEVPLDENNPDQAPISRWTASTSDPHLGSFHSFGGPFLEDLLRFAKIVEETGPFVTRTRDGMFGPKMAVSKDAILFEAEPDELRIADRSGQHIRRFVSIPAAYDPIFSADGSTAAFRGCHYLAAQVPGKLIRCEYHLYVASREDRTPARVNAVAGPQPPVFSPDGRYVYTVARDDEYLQAPFDRGGCLWRVDAAPPHEAAKLWCTTELSELVLHEDPSGATCAVEGRRGPISQWPPEKWQVEVVWLDLPGGRERATVAIDGGGSLATLGKNGLYATHARGGLAYVDLATKRVVRVARPELEMTSFSDHWADETSVYATRQITTKGSGKAPVEEVIAVDVRAELDAPE